jgi:hypothetical protein
MRWLSQRRTGSSGNNSHIAKGDVPRSVSCVAVSQSASASRADVRVYGCPLEFHAVEVNRIPHDVLAVHRGRGLRVHDGSDGAHHVEHGRSAAGDRDRASVAGGVEVGQARRVGVHDLSMGAGTGMRVFHSAFATGLGGSG